MQSILSELIHSKTKTSFYRRVYVAHLINSGANTVPLICEHTGMHRRTAQDTILALNELAIVCQFMGEKRNGHYEIIDWGPIKKDWVKKHLKDVLSVLNL
jgi:hypothetical protein